HTYRAKELAALAARAQSEGASLVTTAKDHVRLPAEFAGHVQIVEVRAHMDDPAALRAILQRALDSRPRHL
ncbi:MAG: hypothetical protein RLZZ157_919, partial [Pseudomonadota bacterium]